MEGGEKHHFPSLKPRDDMQHYREASDHHRRGPDRGARSRRDPFDHWVERTRSYLRSRTLDHWLMFAGSLLLGALLG